MDNTELIHLLRRAARHSREGMEEGRFGMPPPPPEDGPGFGPPPGGPGSHGGGQPRRDRERVLSLLDETEGISQQKLALILGIRPQSLSELLGKLERDGLILREKNPEDRRETLVNLTAEGRERAAVFESERARAGEAFLAPLSEEERETLAELLRRLLEGRFEE